RHHQLPHHLEGYHHRYYGHPSYPLHGLSHYQPRIYQSRHDHLWKRCHAVWIQEINRRYVQSPAR
ncbi:hypothetical protein BGW39_003307, partial [Mortierella sp. 14UC]